MKTLHGSKRAFTLIELLIVVAIIAILAAIAVPNFLEAQVRSKVARTAADMRTIATALESYAVDNNGYPIMGSSPAAWQNYSDFLWFQLPDGTEIYKCQLLTTPIAYISGRTPQDSFMREAFGIGSQASTSRGRGSYLFLNLVGAYERATSGLNWTGAPAAQFASSGFRARFNGSDGPQYDSTWALASPGPDQSYQDPGTDGPPDGFRLNRITSNQGEIVQFTGGNHAIYDPTNGTVSDGNIWRLSGGVPQ